MIFKLMKLHNTPMVFFFYEAPVCVYKRDRNLNELITSLFIRVSTDYADMQKDS